jgi:hypothetical protein
VRHGPRDAPDRLVEASGAEAGPDAAHGQALTIGVPAPASKLWALAAAGLAFFTASRSAPLPVVQGVAQRRVDVLDHIEIWPRT